ncbi:MAG TPA: hypothetical protein VNM15_05240 [Candidatus Binatia bacterium]|nr:hypothetical protein [Candidatus Binatia bacterium]
MQIDALLCAAAGQYRAARRAAYNRGAHEHIIQCLTCGKILTAKSAKRRYCPGQRCRDTHLKRLRRHAAMVRRIKADLERVERARARRIARAITLQLATLRDPQTAWKLDGATLWDKENRRRELIAAREKSELTADEFFQENLSPTEIHRIEAR